MNHIELLAVETIANAVKDMLDFDDNISRLSRRVKVGRNILSSLMLKKKKQIAIEDLFKLIEHGMEFNHIQIFMNRLCREKKNGTFPIEINIK